MIVGFQGEPGAFSEEAAYAHFGSGVLVTGYRDFDALVEAVDAGDVAYGLLPCENSIAGPIARAYDLLLAHEGVCVVDETQHRIVQCLIGTRGAWLGGVERVRSHAVALEQCRRYFKAHPHWRIEPAEDTAGAVRAIVEKDDARVAAIGPALSADRYGGKILERGVQDDEENVTRFFVIAQAGTGHGGLGRVCMAFSLPHEAGSLHRALGTLAAEGLNLRSLVARPRRGRPFEYVFYVELDCPNDRDASALANAIGPDTRILGRY